MAIPEIYQDKKLAATASNLLAEGYTDTQVLQFLSKVICPNGTDYLPSISDHYAFLDNIIIAAKKTYQRTPKGLILRYIEEFFGVTTGDFSVTNVRQYVTESVNKNNGDYRDYRDKPIIKDPAIRKALQRFKEAGIIKKVGSRDGIYRLVNTASDEIDIFSDNSKALNIKWPFRLQDLVHTYPKSLIVIAGEPNAGKSAFLLNTAIKNCQEFDVTYFSSEMGAIELRKRIEKFNVSLDLWKMIKFRERASEFADVIEPDGFNIIDFLEVHDEFYKVGGLMKEIFDKLNTGVAVVAIQKNKGRDSGLGAERGMEKPRLYLSMQPGTIKIIKGKNWVSDITNPNGMAHNFKLVAGCKFHLEGTWHKVE